MSAADVPSLAAPAGGPSSALEAGALRPLEGEPLVSFLMGRRWFGGKGTRPSAARFRDVVPLFDAPPSAVARVEVESGGGRRATYQLPLVLRDAAAGERPRAVLARVGESLIFDATEDAEFRAALGAAVAAGAERGSGALRWVARPLGDSALGAATPSRLGSGEQSNTSILYGESAILKLVRRLEPGVNPDVEIGEFLARAGSEDVPRLLGTIRYEEAGAEPTVAGLMQRLVPNVGDGWAHALGRLGAALRDEAPLAEGFPLEARELGATTRRVHEALAGDPSDPAFAPEPVRPQDLARWADGASEEVRRGLDLLAARRAAGAFSGELDERVGRVLAGAAAAQGRARALAAAVGDDGGRRIRGHGDYHLGQVLRTPDGRFVLIDFEGEPARPLAERRAKTSPLRDVAGMLRSFDYAAAAGLRALEAPAERARRRAEEWRGLARRQFLEGYLTDRPAAPLLPAGRRALESLLALFELEKLFYELAYELDNRPDWVAIPLAGIAGPHGL